MMDSKLIIHPRPLDILCGRGRATHCYSGNVFFRSIVACHLPKYASTNTSKMPKTEVVISVIRECLEQGCRFIKKDTAKGCWVELTLQAMKIKVGHALRDACSDMIRIVEPSIPPTDAARSQTWNDIDLQTTFFEPKKLKPGGVKVGKSENYNIMAMKEHNLNMWNKREMVESNIDPVAIMPDLSPPLDASFLRIPVGSERGETQKTAPTCMDKETRLATAFIIRQQKQLMAIECAEARSSEMSPDCSDGADEKNKLDFESGDATAGTNDKDLSQGGGSKKKDEKEEKEEEIRIPQILEAWGKMSPETQRQIRFLHCTKRDNLAFLHDSLWDAQELADR